MQKSAFITVIFILLFLIYFIYLNVKLDLKDQTKVLSKELNLREKALDQEKLKHQLALYQLENFKEEVAFILKDSNQKHSLESALPLRTLASIVSDVDENKIEEQMFESLFNQAKAKYVHQEYNQAISLLEEFIQKNPLSSNIIEAHYLLVESFYFLKNFEECIKASQTMVQLFPENKFTGFAILRMGELYKSQKKIQQAIEVFELVKMYFSDQELIQLAEKALESLS